MDGPAGFYIGHGEGVTRPKVRKLPRGVASVMPDEVDLEEAGGHGTR
jgi:hypothetical protein